MLVTIILLLRLYTRRWISNGFGLDDVLIICAYVRTSRLSLGPPINPSRGLLTAALGSCAGIHRRWTRG